MDCQLPIAVEINFRCLPSAIPHLISIAIGKHQKIVENIYAGIALFQNPKLSPRYVSLNCLASSM